MKIGNRVAYAEEWNGDDSALLIGTVVEPTDEEVEGTNSSMAIEAAIGSHSGDVMVEWDDGERFWEVPGDLVVIEESGS